MRLNFHPTINQSGCLPACAQEHRPGRPRYHRWRGVNGSVLRRRGKARAHTWLPGLWWQTTAPEINIRAPLSTCRRLHESEVYCEFRKLMEALMSEALHPSLQQGRGADDSHADFSLLAPSPESAPACKVPNSWPDRLLLFRHTVSTNTALFESCM